MRGDISSLGGITSATTAFGNQDGISQENRSGHSYHENPNNISGGYNPNNNYSYSGNGFDQSHKSISDKERTPKHGTELKQGNNNHKNKKDTSPIDDDEANDTHSKHSKGKNPYYFTFFNEKNDQPSNNGDAVETSQLNTKSFDKSNQGVSNTENIS